MEKSIALSILSIYYTWKNINSSCNNNKFKISAPKWNDKFDLPDGSYSISYIQDYFEYILQKHNESIGNPSIRTYANKIENRIISKIKESYHLELLTSETMELLGSNKNKITKNKKGENVPHLEITKVILAHCNIVNNAYQQDSKTYIKNFIYVCSNKSFGELQEISPSNFIFLKTFYSEFQAIEKLFIDQSS